MEYKSTLEGLVALPGQADNLTWQSPKSLSDFR
jgi:hypothetical protein